MIKLGNYKRIKVKLVKFQNEDPRVINEKCICQNGRRPSEGFELRPKIGL